MRSEVKPSNLHLALLAIGLKPGQPLQYSDATKRLIPPQGPPLQIMMEYQKDGKTISVPSWTWMRDVKTKKQPPAFTWVFADHASWRTATTPPIRRDIWNQAL